MRVQEQTLLNRIVPLWIICHRKGSKADNKIENVTSFAGVRHDFSLFFLSDNVVHVPIKKKKIFYQTRPIPHRNGACF